LQARGDAVDVAFELFPVQGEGALAAADLVGRDLSRPHRHDPGEGADLAVEARGDLLLRRGHLLPPLPGVDGEDGEDVVPAEAQGTAAVPRDVEGERRDRHQDEEGGEDLDHHEGARALAVPDELHEVTDHTFLPESAWTGWRRDIRQAG